MKKYFEYTDEVSNKFWEINLKKNQIIITFGRIGIKNPVWQLKKFDSNEEVKIMPKERLEKKQTRDT